MVPEVQCLSQNEDSTMSHDLSSDMHRETLHSLAKFSAEQFASTLAKYERHELETVTMHLFQAVFHPGYLGHLRSGHHGSNETPSETVADTVDQSPQYRRKSWLSASPTLSTTGSPSETPGTEDSIGTPLIDNSAQKTDASHTPIDSSPEDMESPYAESKAGSEGSTSQGHSDDNALTSSDRTSVDGTAVDTLVPSSDVRSIYGGNNDIGPSSAVRTSTDICENNACLEPIVDTPKSPHCIWPGFKPSTSACPDMPLLGSCSPSKNSSDPCSGSEERTMPDVDTHRAPVAVVAREACVQPELAPKAAQRLQLAPNVEGVSLELAPKATQRLQLASKVEAGRLELAPTMQEEGPTELADEASKEHVPLAVTGSVMDPESAAFASALDELLSRPVPEEQSLSADTVEPVAKKRPLSAQRAVWDRLAKGSGHYRPSRVLEELEAQKMAEEMEIQKAHQRRHGRKASDGYCDRLHRDHLDKERRNELRRAESCKGMFQPTVNSFNSVISKKAQGTVFCRLYSSSSRATVIPPVEEPKKPGPGGVAASNRLYEEASRRRAERQEREEILDREAVERSRIKRSASARRPRPSSVSRLSVFDASQSGKEPEASVVPEGPQMQDATDVNIEEFPCAQSPQNFITDFRYVSSAHGGNDFAMRSIEQILDDSARKMPSVGNLASQEARVEQEISLTSARISPDASLSSTARAPEIHSSTSSASPDMSLSARPVTSQLGEDREQTNAGLTGTDRMNAQNLNTHNSIAAAETRNVRNSLAADAIAASRMVQRAPRISWGSDASFPATVDSHGRRCEPIYTYAATSRSASSDTRRTSISSSEASNEVKERYMTTDKTQRGSETSVNADKLAQDE